MGHEPNAPAQHGRVPVVHQGGRGSIVPPRSRLGRRHDQAVSAQQIGERRRRRRAAGSTRQRPCRRRGFDQRHHQQPPSDRLHGERQVEGAEPLTAMGLRNHCRQPLGRKHRPPRLAIDLARCRAQGAQAAGTPVICTQPRRHRSEQGLRLAQQQVQVGSLPAVVPGISSAAPTPAWRRCCAGSRPRRCRP